jgi:hypothetical protein
MSILSILKRQADAPWAPVDSDGYVAGPEPVPRDTRIKMLRDAKGSVNGWSVEQFEADQIVTISRRLADAFVQMGAAEII